MLFFHTEVGSLAPPTDVDTTGGSAGYDPQPVTTAPEDWTQHPLVQVEGGFIGGLALGRVPFGSVVAGAISGPGSRWAEIGRGVGEIFGGGLAFTAGMAGMLGGGAASTTGVFTVPGVLAVVGSAALVAGGVANVKVGAERLGQALSMSSGSGSSGPHGTPATGAKPVHGNDLSTSKPTQGYSLRDRDTGKVLKYGETTLGRVDIQRSIWRNTMLKCFSRPRARRPKCTNGRTRKFASTRRPTEADLRSTGQTGELYGNDALDVR